MRSRRDPEPMTNHVLIPINELGRGRPRMGWACRYCGWYWPELPPIPERLKSCPVPVGGREEREERKSA